MLGAMISMEMPRLMKMKAFVLLGLLVGSLLPGAELAKDDALLLAGSVHVIFERKCNECHGSQLKKPEGKFGYVLDLQRMADNEDYVVRGKPRESDLFRMVRDEEMPPDDHPKTPPLTLREKDLVRRWIIAGAPSKLPETLPVLPEEKPAVVAVKQSAATTKDLAMKTNISLDIKQKPGAEAFAELATKSGLRLNYTKPAHEPVLSIRLKNGSAFDALNYLALCGNLTLKFTDEAVDVVPNVSSPAASKP